MCSIKKFTHSPSFPCLAFPPKESGEEGILKDLPNFKQILLMSNYQWIERVIIPRSDLRPSGPGVGGEAPQAQELVERHL